MVMNYLQGDTLQDFIVTARDLKRDKVFRESTIRSLFDEILRGLRIVHQHKMLHLDIKPANIFITNENKAVLARLRRRARSAEQGRQLHPPDVHAGLRRARDVPPRRHARAVDRHLRDRRLHLRLHAGLPAQRRAAAHRERPPGAVAVAPAQCLLRQPDRSHRVVHVARPAVAPAKRVRAAEGAGARDRAALHQAQLQRAAEAAARKPDDRREGLAATGVAMRFSVYQVSRKGGREKNEDRMGYCYTRDSGLFALADGMGGHPEGEVASQLALQTLAAMFQRDCQADAARPAALPARGDHRRPPPAAALRHREGADRHAAHHGRRLPDAGQRGLLGALRRLAAVPGARRQADRAHARPLLLRAAGDA